MCHPPKWYQCCKVEISTVTMKYLHLSVSPTVHNSKQILVYDTQVLSDASVVRLS